MEPTLGFFIVFKSPLCGHILLLLQHPIEKEKYSVPFAIFGSQCVAVFRGGMYLVLNNAKSQSHNA